VTSPTPGVAYSGIFFTGDRPHWILSTDKGGVQVYPSGHNVVHAFTPCSLWESKNDFLMYTEEVRASLILLETVALTWEQGSDPTCMDS